MRTELERRGVTLDSALWSGAVLQRDPSVIRSVHEAYYRAGAAVATTASYQLTAEGLAAAGVCEEEVGPELDRLLRLSVEVACQAREAVLGEMADPKPTLLVRAPSPVCVSVRVRVCARVRCFLRVRVPTVVADTRGFPTCVWRSPRAGCGFRGAVRGPFVRWE